MRRTLLILFGTMAAMPGPGGAQTLVAAHTIRSHAVLSSEDLSTIEDSVAGALRSPAEAVGMEARVVLYAGRPIHPEDIGPPAAIERNETVTLLYRFGGLTITAEGRSLARAAAGETVRAMNLESRATVTGMVDASGQIFVDAANRRP
ncbi:flagellar basal body P-ring formation chaperone FlgA [Tropicimonas isoalkanivorans]|uniref:Flagella basal body P-ring formation protein FlgA n=1 Tax=Tropicimonas isoalkanivorans TaxID=441112 RepID=A0A1I1PJR9_9RHOB|nr:flagellar basal body P-ring formation chaperone FlgA [Tropicimonas isoalkanivorans]SFD09982.1 flagella basal body P-ring formation protein FlgA [Tropicimonas isoalkanivorans]